MELFLYNLGLVAFIITCGLVVLTAFVFAIVLIAISVRVNLTPENQEKFDKLFNI